MRLRLPRLRLVVLSLVVFLVLTLDGNPQRTQKIHIVLGEGRTIYATFRARFRVIGLLGRHLVQTDRRLQHQQHVEPVPPYILHNAGDLLALNDRFVDGLTKLLDQLAQL